MFLFLDAQCQIDQSVCVLIRIQCSLVSLSFHKLILYLQQLWHKYRSLTATTAKNKDMNITGNITSFSDTSLYLTEKSAQLVFSN